MDYFQKVTYNMKQAIHELPDEDKKYLLEFKPNENQGYYMDQNSRYNKIKDILSIKTNSDGHSGASFAVCLRGAIEEIIEYEGNGIIQAEEVEGVDKTIETLNPIH